MAAKQYLRSFAAGEIAPELFGRIDLDKFQTGVATSRNMIVLPHGPLQSRPGFEYVLETKDSTKASRLIPFTFNAQQTAVLEFGDLYIRFHIEGATLLDSGTPRNVTGIAQSSPAVVTYTGMDPTEGAWVYLQSVGGMFEIDGRFVLATNVNTAANTFEAYDLDGSPIDASAFTPYTTGGTALAVYEIVSPYAEVDLSAIRYTQSADVITLCHPSHPVRELRRLGAVNWTITDAVFAPIIAPPTSVLATATVGSGTVSHRYVVTSFDADTYEESIASNDDDALNDLTVLGNYNTVTWLGVTGAAGYAIYKQKGTAYGYVGRVPAGTLSFVDDNIIPDMSKNPPVVSDPFAATDDYPGTVTYAQQRRCFAGTNNRPQNMWMTRSGSEGNFCQSVPTQDDDAIIFGIKGTQQNRIRHLVSLDDLVVLTHGGVYVVRSVDGVLTPSTVDPRPQSSVACSAVQPVLAESACLYSQEQGSHVREVLYTSDNTGRAGYSNNDVSLLAPHLFDGYTIVSMAFANNSTLPSLWAVRSDGVLLGMTYVPGQNVRAWHRHETDGSFESVASVSEDGEVALYAIVNRSRNGDTVRYVERLHPRLYEDLTDVFAVDSGVSYSGPARAIFYAPHLKGQTVAGLADGGVVSVEVDAEGRIELEDEAENVCLGLTFTPRVKTLPVMLLASAGHGQGTVKNVTRAHIRVKASGGFFIGQTEGETDGRLVEARWRTTEPFDEPPALRTGVVSVLLDPKWNEETQVVIEQRSPLPLIVLSATLEVAEGG